MIDTTLDLPETEEREAVEAEGPSAATGYVYDPVFLEHEFPGHPERPERLAAVMHGLAEDGLLEQMEQIPSRPAGREEMLAVHTEAHLRLLEGTSGRAGGFLDPDTFACARTWDAAVTAAGSLIALALAVADGRLRNGFALVRPPGHHALPDRTMGFCLIDNAALAVRALQGQFGLERVAVVDFDVHHGNGTQAAFAEDPSVLYVSSHQFPFFPGTGRMGETGRGEGEGTAMNFPLPAGAGDGVLRRFYEEIAFPAVRRFAPQFILVSAGYDGHWRDPLAGLQYSLDGLARLSQGLVALAGELCGGRIVFTLEGGYDLSVLRTGVGNSVRALLGRGDVADPIGPPPGMEPDLDALLEEARQAFLE